MRTLHRAPFRGFSILRSQLCTKTTSVGIGGRISLADGPGKSRVEGSGDSRYAPTGRGRYALPGHRGMISTVGRHDNEYSNTSQADGEGYRWCDSTPRSDHDCRPRRSPPVCVEDTNPPPLLDEVDILLGKLADAQPSAPGGRVVQPMDGTQGRASEYKHAPGAQPFTGDEEAGIDGLFSASVAYHRYKKESPTHRLILWFRLNGHKPKEIATTLRVTPQTVYNVQGQPWFQEAFCKLSAELGKDAVTTFLEGEVLSTVQKLVYLRDNAESEAVAKASCDSILDRFLGKSVAKTEVKLSGGTTATVYDVAAMQKEMAILDKQLAARGIASGPTHGAN